MAEAGFSSEEYQHFMKVTAEIFIFQSYPYHSFFPDINFYSASSNPLLLRGTPDYSIDAVSELTCESATGKCE